MCRDDKHSLILTYKNTGENPNFPIILCIGREPNSPQEVGTHLGSYDFDEVITRKIIKDGRTEYETIKLSKTAFWNTSYGSIARIVGINTNNPCNALKQQCRDKNYTSFIAYADYSYQGIPASITNKYNFRANLDISKINAHIDQLYNDPFFINKVKLVIFSGITKKCGFNQKDIDYALSAFPSTKKKFEVPFFIGMQAPTIMEKLNRNQDIINEINIIYNVWRNS